MNDLFQTICDNYKGDIPPECTRVKVEIYYETLNAQSRRFFVQELRPTFEQIRESFDLQLIPFGKMQNKGADENNPNITIGNALMVTSNVWAINPSMCNQKISDRQ